MRFGLVAFGVGSVLAATASSPAILIAARVVQGWGAAFLVPGSLAMIDAAFDKAHQSAAIGAWTAWTGTAFALGPLLGGLAVDLLGWRWIYVLSAIPMVIGFALTFWICPMPEPSEHAQVDLAGGLLSAAGLAATVYALIESQRRGWVDPVVAGSFIVGVVALIGFIRWQRRAPHPMLALHLFSSRNFAGGNLATAFVYGGLVLGSLVIVLYIQQVAGYSATAAGLATLPIPVLSFLFARHVGSAATRVGPRIFLIARPDNGGGWVAADPAHGARFQRFLTGLARNDAVRNGIGRHRHAADVDLHGSGGPDVRRHRRRDQQRGLEVGGADRGGVYGTDRHRYVDRRELSAAHSGQRGVVHRGRGGLRSHDHQPGGPSRTGVVRSRRHVTRPPRCPTRSCQQQLIREAEIAQPVKEPVEL
jgi:MFS family permease